jgi:hypothetical protein
MYSVVLAAAVCLGVVFLTLYCLRRFLAKKREEKEKKKKKKSKGPVDLQVSRYTDKKEKKIFLIDKEIQSGTLPKSYMRKGFLIYEEMRKCFTIYEEAVIHM